MTLQFSFCQTDLATVRLSVPPVKNAKMSKANQNEPQDEERTEIR